jgi:peroxiredoxin
MQAPDLQIEQWFNTAKPLALPDLRGKVVILEAFQMLCPGCVSHSIPLAQKIRSAFPESAVAVVGLHTVFEHHAAMTPVSLAAFLLEYNITFPVGVDMAGSTDIPLTMKAYKMRGTPSMVIIDQKGMIRAHHYGSVSELRIGAEIATLLCEAQGDNLTKSQPAATSGRCDDSGCGV